MGRGGGGCAAGLREGVLLFPPVCQRWRPTTRPQLCPPAALSSPLASCGSASPSSFALFTKTRSDISFLALDSAGATLPGGGRGERNGEAGDWRGNAPQLQQSRFLREKQDRAKHYRPRAQDSQPSPLPGRCGQPQAYWSHTRCPGVPSLSEQPCLWEPTFSREGLSKLSIWLFSSLLRRRLQLEPRVFLREFLRNWGWGKKAQVRSAPEGGVTLSSDFPSLAPSLVSRWLHPFSPDPALVLCGLGGCREGVPWAASGALGFQGGVSCCSCLCSPSLLARGERVP